MRATDTENERERQREQLLKFRRKSKASVACAQILLRRRTQYRDHFLILRVVVASERKPFFFLFRLRRGQGNVSSS